MYKLETMYVFTHHRCQTQDMTKDQFYKRTTSFPALRSVAIPRQKTGAVEYTNCTSTEESDPPPLNECPEYDTKQFNGEVPVM